MLDHVGINVTHLGTAKAYYDELMPVLGYEPFIATDEQFGYQPAGGKPGTTIFFYEAPEKAPYIRKRPGVQHLAFWARTRGQVEAAHTKAVELGSEILFSPQLFPEYHENYFASFWFDAHGFLLEIVCHKPDQS